MLNIILIISGVLNLGLVAIRLTESIYELKKYPEMDTLGEIIQVWKNFWKIEKYK